jgi:hypothetical protein
MSYLASIFFVALPFVSAIFNSGNHFALQRTQIPKIRDAENAKNLTTNSFAATWRPLRPDYDQLQSPGSPISKISYSSAGGKAGNYENLDIKPDSLIYVQGHRGVEKTIKEKTLKSFWNKLTKSINFTHFDKIQSDPGHSLYDGIDITITIEKGKQKHSIVNGNEDSVNYVKIKPFTDLLQKKLAEIRKKIVWQK